MSDDRSPIRIALDPDSAGFERRLAAAIDRRAHLGHTHFADGGVIRTAGEPVRVELAPDECVIRPAEGRQARCYRSDHPTPNSGCTRERWIKHVSEDSD